MFRTLARLIVDPTLTGTDSDPDAVFAYGPIQLRRWLDEVFAADGVSNFPPLPPTALGSALVSARLRHPAGLLDDLRSGVAAATPPVPPLIPPVFAPAPFLGSTLKLPWDHGIYGFLIESTGIVEIMSEVVRRYSVGETLAPPTPGTLSWTRTTKGLFYTNAFSWRGAAASARIEPDIALANRNLYWRFFGTDLPHLPAGNALVEGQPWKRDVGPGANVRFFAVFSDLLKQVSQGLVNDKNGIGPNPTDDSYIAYLCQSLAEMLTMRRRGGMLAQDEYECVNLLSWFHLTVEQDTSLVTDLKAEAGTNGNPADRLAAIGARVGLAPAARSRELFELATLISPLLWFIEAGVFNDEATAKSLHSTTPSPTIAQLMTRVIDLWQSATGIPVKASTVVAVNPDGSTPQPLRLPAPTAAESTPAFATPVGVSERR